MNYSQKTGQNTLFLHEGRDKLLCASLGKTVSVFYNDTFNSVSFKTGRLIDFDLFSLKILEHETQEFCLIPRQKCIRIEIGGESLARIRA